MLGLPVSADAFMRLAGLLVLVFLVTTPARAQHVDADGEVVGIVTAIVNPSGSRTFAGIGFALPIEAAAGAVGENPL